MQWERQSGDFLGLTSVPPKLICLITFQNDCIFSLDLSFPICKMGEFVQNYGFSSSYV